MRLKLTALGLALLTPLAAFAQEAPPPAPPPPPPPADQAPPPPPPPPPEPAPPAPPAPPPAPAAPTAGPTFKWEGLIDTYYQYNFTGDPSIQGPAFRAFDVQSNSFTLSFAKLALQADADPVSFRIDFGYGQLGAIVNGLSRLGSGPMAPADPAGAVLYGNAWFLEQGFGTVKLGGGLATLDAGKFATWAGAEVNEANKNWLYSRSLLFNGIPVLHTGLRLTLHPTDMVAIGLSVTNGARENNDPDNNGWKTIGAQLALTPSAATSAYVNAYFGKEGNQGNEGDMSIVIDAVLLQTLSESLALYFNFDYVKLGDGNWFGAALALRAAVSEALYIAARGEFLKSEPMFYAAFPEDTTLFEGTLMAGLPFGKNFEIRLELRGDFSNKEVFVKGADPRKNQFTGTAAFLSFF
jgi:hypothetical protein